MPAESVPTGIPLVTGATGFAGGHLVEHLLEDEPYVAAWGHAGGRQTTASDNDGRVTWFSVDVTDADAVARSIAAIQPSAVYHCAGIADVHGAWSQSARALRVNVMGTQAVLDALDRISLRAPILITGSALVYRPSLEALSEDSPLGPSSPYGVSKLAQEMVAESASGHIFVTRSFNHAGPRQSASYVTSSFARQIAEAEAGLREPVLRVGNLDARRDLTDVRDTVRAYRLLVERGRPRQPYNVCRGEAFRVGDLLDSLLTYARVRLRVETDPSRLRPSDNPVVLGNPSRLHQDTGWTPRRSIEQTLNDLLEYWRHVVRGPSSSSSA
jgi:GDP-4-dehydro-6-deoxy-D-mannose reductase